MVLRTIYHFCSVFSYRASSNFETVQMLLSLLHAQTYEWKYTMRNRSFGHRSLTWYKLSKQSSSRRGRAEIRSKQHQTMNRSVRNSFVEYKISVASASEHASVSERKTKRKSFPDAGGISEIIVFIVIFIDLLIPTSSRERKKAI